MGTKDRLKTKPPLPPKPQIICGTTQKVLVSPPRTTTTTDARYRPTPKPRLRKPRLTLNQDDKADQASLLNTDTAASNGSSESHSVPPACPISCPCVCHNASQNRPKKTQEYADNYMITSENKVNKDPKRVPPDIPVPARPHAKEPLKRIISNVERATDDYNKSIFSEADLPKHDDDTAPKRNEPEPSSDALKTHSQKPVPTARKRVKEINATHEEYKYQHDEHAESLRIELCQTLSLKTKEKPKIMNKNLGKLSEKVTGSQAKVFQKKNSVDDLYISTKQNKLSIFNKPPSTVSSCSRSQSFQDCNKMSSKWPEQSSAAMLPPSGLKVNKKVKNDAYSWKMLDKKLWQEHCVVKESGILNKITKEELHLQESIYEVATSEQSYLERLTVVVNHFMESPEISSAIAPQDQKSLFSSIHKIREISQNFLDSMVQKLGSGLLCEGLCDVVLHYATGPFTAYVDYIRNMPCQKNTLINLRKKSPRFVEIVNKLQEDPCCNRLTLESFLSLPFQRISNIKVLMETILKRTDSNSNVQASAEAALTRISEVLDLCNREVGKVKQIEDLVSIVNKIEFEGKALPLVSASRWLIRDGEMMQIALIALIFVQKKNCPVHLILFNDLLLVASKKGSDRYVVHDHVHRSLIEVTEGAKVEDDLEGYDVSRVFLLAILQNHKGGSNQLLLQASTLEERDSWLEVLSSEEGVYKEWDCPQVQCIEAYNGQQPGELSLQLGDIVSIIQKTSNGLMKGRSPDGESGWFPAKCVMEISNEHVKRRNLRRRNHVLQIAANIVKHRRICQEQPTTTCFNKH
ncbi:ephexin-1 isoform X1 [Tachysurus ichikawai]